MIFIFARNRRNLPIWENHRYRNLWARERSCADSCDTLEILGLSAKQRQLCVWWSKCLYFRGKNFEEVTTERRDLHTWKWNFEFDHNSKSPKPQPKTRELRYSPLWGLRVLQVRPSSPRKHQRLLSPRGCHIWWSRSARYYS